MIPVPKVTRLDTAFGNVGHLPPRSETTKPFSMYGDHPYMRFVSRWFMHGIPKEEMSRLKPREGINANEALDAIGAILASFAPKHEHKIEGCAFLLHEWFELAPPPEGEQS